MEKEFLSYSQSLSLKELGFDLPCFGYFDCERDFKFIQNKTKYLDCEVSRPTFSQTFKWFREKYGYWSYIKEATKGTCRFNIEKFDEKFFNSGLFGSYEEAESSCVDKLIDIIKKK